jgi:hypothetical protein
LINRWRFDETTGDAAADSAGTINATLAGWGVAEPKWVAGRFGGGLQFDGSDNRVFTDSAISTEDFTVSFWLKRTGNGGTNPRIVAPGSGSEGVTYNRGDGNGLGFFTNGGSAVDATAPALNAWTQYVVVVDRVNDVATLYRDGELAASDDISSVATNNIWIFGHNADLGNHNDTFDGVLDEIRLYDRLLSAEDAARLADFGKTTVEASDNSSFTEGGAAVAIAASATVTNPDLTNLGGSTLTVSHTQNADLFDQLLIQSEGTGAGQISVSGSDVAFEGTTIGTITSAGNSVPLTVLLNFNATLQATQALVRKIAFRSVGEGVSELQRELQIRIDDSSGAAGEGALVTVDVTALQEDGTGDVFQGIVHRWTFNETSGNVAADIRSGNNANLAGWSFGESQWVQGRYGNGLDFDGNDTRAITSAAISLTQYTATFWLKREGTGGINPRLIAPGGGGHDIVYDREHNNGVIVFSNGGSVIDTTHPPLNQFTHYTVVIDTVGDVATIYRDGQLVNSGTINASGTFTNWVFGHNFDPNNQNDTLNGVLDEVRLYNRLLSADEAAQLANVGKTKIVASGTRNYIENGTAVALAPFATVTDDDGLLSGSKLTVAITQNSEPADRLLIRTDGTGPGQISLNGSDVQFAGTTIGTRTSALGEFPLTVVLNGNATVAATQALVRHIDYQSASESPSALQRQLRLAVDDVSGIVGVAATVKINVTPQNDAPVLNISLNPALTTIDEDAVNPPSTLVSSLLSGAVTDPDAGASQGIGVTTASNFRGTWQFSLDGGASWQALSVPSASARLLPSTARIRFLPKTDFNGEVKLYYRAWDRTGGSSGSTLALSGNAGRTKSLSTAQENALLIVKAKNDPPKLALSGTVSYMHDKPAITLAASATVSDVDSANFFGGRLRVRIVDGASSSNRLAIGAGFMVDANNNVLQNGVIIGKRTSNGFGTSELIITFNTKATPSVVQQLVRAITFKTVGGSPGIRNIAITVSDGDGGLSGEAFKKVNVT